jgi:hypothetical protein
VKLTTHLYLVPRLRMHGSCKWWRISYVTELLLVSQVADSCLVSQFYTRVFAKVSGLAAWSENCKCYSSLLLGALVSLFCESV